MSNVLHDITRYKSRANKNAANELFIKYESFIFDISANSESNEIKF